MQKAKQAVQDFVSHDGKHKTTVDETVRKAVTDEHVRPHQHENVTTAVDREVHQDHHHTTVQPITHKETLPEKHTHNMLPTEHKSFDHSNESETRAHLERDAAKYKDSSVTHNATTSTSTAPTVSGERIHHHVHEHVQPVIQKETIAPHVIHTTVPVHETHRSEAVHHGTSVLPAKTLDEVSGKTGVLDGRGSRVVDEFEGCPKPYKQDLQTETHGGDKHIHLHAGGNHDHTHTGTTGTGIGSSNVGSHNLGAGHQTRDGVAGSGIGSTTTPESHHQPLGTSGGAGNTSTGTHGLRSGHNTTRDGVAGTGIGSPTATGAHGQTHGGAGHVGRDTTSSTTGTKPSLMDKLNPFKDSDHDGKKGMMD